jgi:uncharacterized protein (DUF885 family)
VHPLRQQLNPRAYFEGWAIYAETLARETRVYHDDPRGESAICNPACFVSQECSWTSGSTPAARRNAGRKFDLAAFHDLGLRPGALPQSLLQHAIDPYTDTA